MKYQHMLERPYIREVSKNLQEMGFEGPESPSFRDYLVVGMIFCMHTNGFVLDG